MDFGNVFVVLFTFVCAFGMIAFWGINADKLFVEKSANRFVLFNDIVLLGGLGAYVALYHCNMFWFWKSVCAILIFDILIMLILFVRVYVFDHYYDSVDIQDGTLKKVTGNHHLRILKLPNNCVKIEDDALSNLPELEVIYFGKNVEFVSEKMLESHHILHTLYFANPETKYDEKIKEKYTIKQK